MASQREVVRAERAPEAIGPYSHAVRAGDLLFCSGQIPLRPDTGELIGVSVGAQTQRCLDNLSAVCEAAGTTLQRALRVTIYMVELRAFAEVNDVFAQVFPTDPPARATVGVAALPRGALIEIDAIVAM
jgi:2-iminobutanoate/2-iminopropanoate deaminase